MEEETSRALSPSALEENLCRDSGYASLNGIGFRGGTPRWRVSLIDDISLVGILGFAFPPSTIIELQGQGGALVDELENEFNTIGPNPPPPSTNLTTSVEPYWDTTTTFHYGYVFPFATVVPE